MSFGTSSCRWKHFLLQVSHFPCPQEHLHGVCRIAHQTGLKEARKFWEEGQRADRQPHHISLVSSAKHAKNNNSRITDVWEAENKEQMSCESQGLKGRLGYLRQPCYFIPSMHCPRGRFALSHHLLSGKPELFFAHLVTKHLLLTSSLGLCYFLDDYTEMRLRAMTTREMRLRAMNFKLKAKVWSQEKICQTEKSWDWSGGNAWWSTCVWVMLLVFV